MKCPNCRALCPDDTSFCPKCDAVLDESLLELSRSAPGDDDVTPAPDEDEAPQRARLPAHRPQAQRRRSPEGRAEQSARPRHRPPPADEAAERPRKRRPAPIAIAEAEEEAAAAPRPSANPTANTNAEEGGRYVGKYSQYWDDDEPPPRKKPEAPVMATEGGRQYRYGQGIQESTEDTGNLNELPNDPLSLVKDSWKAFLALPFFQRVTASSSVGLFFFSMIPWSYFTNRAGTQDSEYTTANFLGMFLAALCIFGLVLQKSDTLPKIPRKHLPLVPLAVGLLGALAIVLVTIYLMASRTYSPAMTGLVMSFLSALIIFLSGGMSFLKKE
ncbi:MAG: hypothetical protein LBM75_11855 [Myxococcales bacterium]|jgi:hypothetical protein|nr:hypothetical protein [Myxococcales bacterium]